jgi:hypothetical protein
MTDLTHTEFLLACIVEDEAAIRARWKGGDMTDDEYWNTPYQPSRLLAECEAKRRIIALHESWPALVETPIETGRSLMSSWGPDTVLRVSKQIAWLTTCEYVARFGTDPPTAPILALLTLSYADRPGCRPEWLP